MPRRGDAYFCSLLWDACSLPSLNAMSKRCLCSMARNSPNLSYFGSRQEANSRVWALRGGPASHFIISFNKQTNNPLPCRFSFLLDTLPSPFHGRASFDQLLYAVQSRAQSPGLELSPHELAPPCSYSFFTPHPFSFHPPQQHSVTERPLFVPALLLCKNL